MPFPPSSYTAPFLVSIERTVTRERLLRYLGATGQNLTNALLLYEYNVALSATMYGLLHGIEVAIRNAMHHTLTARCGGPAWYDRIPLSAYWQDQLAEAKSKVRRGSSVLPGRVIAELSFGFWVDLVARHNHNHLWVGKRLIDAFPHTAERRATIHARLQALRHLRNRISHHERILTTRAALHTGDGLLTLPQVLECVEWICPDTACWLRDRFRYRHADAILAAVAATGAQL